MGCGSGVLAMAAAKLWPCRVLAVDNDAPSIPVAAENLKANGVADAVTLLLADGFRDARVRRNGPYRLILANILAEPLCRMRSEEHTSELQSLMRISYAVFCLKKKNTPTQSKTK